MCNGGRETGRKVFCPSADGTLGYNLIRQMHTSQVTAHDLHNRCVQAEQEQRGWWGEHRGRGNRAGVQRGRRPVMEVLGG